MKKENTANRQASIKNKLEVVEKTVPAPLPEHVQRLLESYGLPLDITKAQQQFIEFAAQRGTAIDALAGAVSTDLGLKVELVLIADPTVKQFRHVLRISNHDLGSHTDVPFPSVTELARHGELLSLFLQQQFAGKTQFNFDDAAKTALADLGVQKLEILQPAVTALR